MDGHEASVKSDTYDEKGRPEKDVGNASEDIVFGEDTRHSSKKDNSNGKHGEQKKVYQHVEPSGEVNMEATIDPNDVIRAGGFGARDGLSSVLPMASDSTDFESSVLDMRDFEEPQVENQRPGLGWRSGK